MSRPSITTTACLSAALAAAPAFIATADPIDWKTVAGWDISFYPAAEGCQAFAKFEEGTAFFIGFDNTDDILAIEVTLMDSRWASIEEGRDYEIEVTFGDETPWSLSMSGMDYGGLPGLNIMFDATGDKAELFIREFRRETHMTWKYGQATLGRFSLSGSRRAFDEVLRCQKSYLEALGGPNAPFDDPFAAPARGSDDPFAE